MVVKRGFEPRTTVSMGGVCYLLHYVTMPSGLVSAALDLTTLEGKYGSRYNIENRDLPSVDSCYAVVVVAVVDVMTCDFHV